jgi:hypothetical protein
VRIPLPYSSMLFARHGQSAPIDGPDFRAF